MSFFDKLNEAIARNQSLLFVGLDPNPEMMPAHQPNGDEIENLVEQLGDWLQFVIDETADYVCAYKPTLGFYTALGSAGLDLLERTLSAIPKHIPVILDAKYADLNTSTLVARTAFEQWQVDAVTIAPFAGQDQVASFLMYPDKAVFILCCTSNPGAIALQEYPNSQEPLYLQVVQEARAWGTPEQLGLEVGTTSADVLRRVRAIAPERLILARSIWQGGNLYDVLAAGLSRDGEGLLIPVPQDLLANKHLGRAIQSLREEINQIREQLLGEALNCDLWIPDVCPLAQHPYLELILQLYDIGCIMFGEFVQASGATFPYYIDLRKIISNPQLFHQVLTAYADILQNLTFDRIAGIPYGSLPTATGLSLHLERPMIFPRKEVKAHGTRRLIEGNFYPGETVVVVDDILISGKSAIEGAEKLQSAGLNVEDIVVLIDHEQGVKARLEAQGYRAHSVLTISEITETLYQAGRITTEQFAALKES